MEGKKASEDGSNPEESTGKMMGEVMTELEKRSDLGVLSVRADDDSPYYRIDFFIAPVDKEIGKSIEDGGDADFVFATAYGFFAVRVQGTKNGRLRYDELQRGLLENWKRSNRVVFSANDDKRSVFYKETSSGHFVLRDDLVLQKTVTDEDLGFGQLVPVGEETVIRAFEASKEKARELKMLDPKTGIRLQQSQQAARSLLDKMKES